MRQKTGRPSAFESAARFAGAAVLAAGLILPASGTSRAERGGGPKSECTESKITFVSASGRDGITYKEGRCTVQEGEAVLHLMFTGAEYRQYDVTISKIGRKGIELDLDAKAFRSGEQGKPVKIRYGKTVTVREGANAFEIKAVRRSGNGAVVEITHKQAEPDEHDDIPEPE